MTNLIKTSGSNQIAVAKHNAEKYNKSWFVFGPFVGNGKGRKGYEQYDALEVTADGEFNIIPASPKQ